MDLLSSLIDQFTVLSGNSSSAWILFLVAVLLCALGARLITGLLRKLAEQRRQDHFYAYMLKALSRPMNLIGGVIGIDLGLQLLSLPAGVHAGIERTLLLGYIVAIFLFLLDLAGYIDVLVRRRSDRSGGDYGQHLGPAIRKVLRVFLVILGMMVIVDSVFEQDLGAWLAGFGVAGLAVSLAAQDSFKSFFGAVTIFADKPFKIGQRIVFGGYDGIVEEIGFRSVRIRTLVGHLVTVPNAAIVNDSVENIGERPYIRRLFTINLTYDTPPEKMREALHIVRDILDSPELGPPIHPTIQGDEFPPRVFFKELSAYSLDILVIYWFTPPAYWDYLAHGEAVNLAILERFNAAGIDFAFPSQTLYHAGDPERLLAIHLDNDQRLGPAEASEP